MNFELSSIGAAYDLPVIDGAPFKNVRKVTVICEVDHVPKVIIECDADGAVGINLNGAEVTIH